MIMKARMMVVVLAVIMNSCCTLFILTGCSTVPEKPKDKAVLSSEMNKSNAALPADYLTLLAHNADAYLSANNGMGGARTIFAQALVDGVAGPTKDKKLSDYYLLDVRPPADYAAGHISGAVNVPLGNVAKPDVLAKLPMDRPILVICHTGHTASIATAILDLLGYDAWTLRFGMTSWKASSPTAVWSSAVKQNITGGNYPVVTGTQP
jgi:rhodanese-related sulfurtransferase